MNEYLNKLGEILDIRIADNSELNNKNLKKLFNQLNENGGAVIVRFDNTEIQKETDHIFELNNKSGTEYKQTLTRKQLQEICSLFDKLITENEILKQTIDNLNNENQILRQSSVENFNQVLNKIK